MSITKNYLYRNAVEDDIPSVAKIHLIAFEGFFLSDLGYRFICLMYRAFLRSPRSLFVVIEMESQELVGFAVGSFGEQKDRWLAIRFLPQFLFAIVPAFFRQPGKVCKRLLARFFEQGASPQLPSNAAFLRSIGVLPSIRGAGAAATLLQAFEDQARCMGAGSVYLTTDELKNERAQHFYFRCGYYLDDRFQQDGERWMWLMSKKFKESRS
jgi:GNAT superfamily N-acetyltransferase